MRRTGHCGQGWDGWRWDESSMVAGEIDPGAGASPMAADQHKTTLLRELRNAEERLCEALQERRGVGWASQL